MDLLWTFSSARMACFRYDGHLLWADLSRRLEYCETDFRSARKWTFDGIENKVDFCNPLRVVLYVDTEAFFGCSLLYCVDFRIGLKFFAVGVPVSLVIVLIHGFLRFSFMELHELVFGPLYTNCSII